MTMSASRAARAERQLDRAVSLTLATALLAALAGAALAAPALLSSRAFAQPAPVAIEPDLYLGGGAKAGEITDRTAIVHVRITATPNQMAGGTIPGAEGEARLRYGTDEALREARTTGWERARADAHANPVGVPIDGVEIKVADNGEILVKSPGLLKGYYKNPEATAEVLTADGWYHTSDAGFLDAHGHLKIIDRVKDVGRIKGGPNDGAMFAPKYVENKLKFFPHIKEVVAYGDQREKVCVMINIDFDAVGNWAERRNLSYAGYTDLAQKPEVYQLIQECVEKVNADLAEDALLAGSQVSRFLVLHKELDADDGELTRTNKVRRGFIADKYKPLVDGLYEGKAEQFIETVVKFEDGRTGSVSATLKISDAKTFTPVKAAA